MSRNRFFSALVATLLIAASLPSLVRAQSTRITHGDVEAALNAFTTGGRTVLSLQSATAGFDAAPADFHGSNGAIRPFGPWDGLHVCVSDWHVLIIAQFDGGDKSYKMQDAQNYLSQVYSIFVLDNQTVPTTRTSIKRFLNPAPFGLEQAYGFQQGAILAPGELSLGKHTLLVHVVDPVYGDTQNNITFYVDDTNSPACN